MYYTSAIHIFLGTIKLARKYEKKYRLLKIHVFIFIKTVFMRKWASKTQKLYENVKKSTSLKWKSYDF